MSTIFANTPPEGAALFSPCRLYRYSLWRRWDAPAKGYVMFVGLNPSTADENLDDPTIRRCIGFAKAWGYAGLCMTNLFAFRATKPSDMRLAHEPIGANNDVTLKRLAQEASVIVAAWGTNGIFLGKDREVRLLLPDLHCLRLTKAGHPSHPLYLPGNLTPVQMPQK